MAKTGHHYQGMAMGLGYIGFRKSSNKTNPEKCQRGTFQQYYQDKSYSRLRNIIEGFKIKVKIHKDFVYPLLEKESLNYIELMILLQNVSKHLSIIK